MLVGGSDRLGGPIDLDVLIAHLQSLAQPFPAAVEGRMRALDGDFVYLGFADAIYRCDARGELLYESPSARCRRTIAAFSVAVYFRRFFLLLSRDSLGLHTTDAYRVTFQLGLYTTRCSPRPPAAGQGRHRRTQIVGATTWCLR